MTESHRRAGEPQENRPTPYASFGPGADAPAGAYPPPPAHPPAAPAAPGWHEAHRP
ncbi:serine protease, partial [Streptomyces bambusae]|nr:serine protease [Streptomyces bambusae]